MPTRTDMLILCFLLTSGCGLKFDNPIDQENHIETPIEPEVDLSSTLWLDTVSIAQTLDTIGCRIAYHFTLFPGIMDSLRLWTVGLDTSVAATSDVMVAPDESHIFEYRLPWRTSLHTGDSTTVYYALRGRMFRLDSSTALGEITFIFNGFRNIAISP